MRQPREDEAAVVGSGKKSRNQPAVNPAKLFADYTQFVTQEDLHLRSVLFPNAQTVKDSRRWVAGGGVFSAIIWARRLQRAFRTLVLGKPFHSHAAERMVHIGKTMQIRCAIGELNVAPRQVLLRTALGWTGAKAVAFAVATNWRS
jgi:hypothetical protein